MHNLEIGQEVVIKKVSGGSRVGKAVILEISPERYTAQAEKHNKQIIVVQFKNTEAGQRSIEPVFAECILPIVIAPNLSKNSRPVESASF